MTDGADIFSTGLPAANGDPAESGHWQGVGGARIEVFRKCYYTARHLPPINNTVGCFATLDATYLTFNDTSVCSTSAADVTVKKTCR